MTRHTSHIMNIVNIIIFAIVITLGYSFLFCLSAGLKTNLTKVSVIDVPHDIKCVFKEEGCEENNITPFTLCMSLLYFLVGYKIPGYYITALVLALGTQIIRQYIDSQGSFVIDPLANMTGYTLGSILSSK
jgi:hypothetical protein